MYNFKCKSIHTHLGEIHTATGIIYILYITIISMNKNEKREREREHAHIFSIYLLKDVGIMR
jgi:hypothetical protein